MRLGSTPMNKPERLRYYEVLEDGSIEVTNPDNTSGSTYPPGTEVKELRKLLSPLVLRKKPDLSHWVTT